MSFVSKSPSLMRAISFRIGCLVKWSEHAHLNTGCVTQPQGHAMTTTFRLYRGLEIYLLIYPHRATRAGFGHNYEEGFEASVRISEHDTATHDSRSRVFRVPRKRPFENAGDARRASAFYAEQVIDHAVSGGTFWDRE
jgi:hypothetical protein